MTSEDYARIQQQTRLSVRLSEAKALVEQAEDLMRAHESLSFESALALLERLRKEEPDNLSIRQQISERISEKASGI